VVLSREEIGLTQTATPGKVFPADFGRIMRPEEIIKRHFGKTVCDALQTSANVIKKIVLPDCHKERSFIPPL
jgi:hypothetical protein